jgi:hypothetical protein
MRRTTIIQTCVASRETHSTQRIQYSRFAVGALSDHNAAWFGGILPPGGDSIGCAAPPAYPVSAPKRRTLIRDLMNLAQLGDGSHPRRTLSP